MDVTQKTKITVQTEVSVPVAEAWKFWTLPAHITKWNSASPDWHTPRATNDLRKGGRFTARMEARDGSAGFDFGGTYEEVKPQSHISYSLDDGRKVKVDFTAKGNATLIVETFDAETENSPEMQRSGWQAILDNFKAYAESAGKG
jgi:uncharacterized protein YndB with AHSA1/START domain